MSSNPYVPVGRLDTEPVPGTFPTREQLRAALDEALRGVDRGAYDDRIAAWALRFLDVPTVLTVASWVERGRDAERRAVADEYRAAIRRVFASEAALPADELAPSQIEQAYRDGMVRIVSALGLMDAVEDES